jgi:hypothetical protein
MARPLANGRASNVASPQVLASPRCRVGLRSAPRPHLQLVAKSPRPLDHRTLCFLKMPVLAVHHGPARLPAARPGPADVARAAPHLPTSGLPPAPVQVPLPLLAPFQTTIGGRGMGIGPGFAGQLCNRIHRRPAAQSQDPVQLPITSDYRPCSPGPASSPARPQRAGNPRPVPDLPPTGHRSPAVALAWHRPQFLPSPVPL